MTPGYGDEVIFADGTFIDGSTAELSADGPIRPPYVVYCQVRRHAPTCTARWGSRSKPTPSLCQTAALPTPLHRDPCCLWLACRRPAFKDPSFLADHAIRMHRACLCRQSMRPSPRLPRLLLPPQGGTHWTHWAYVLESAVAAMRQADAAGSN